MHSKKRNNEHIKFNLQYENGLPLKEALEVECEIFKNDDEKIPISFYVYIKKDDLHKIKSSDLLDSKLYDNNI